MSMINTTKTLREALLLCEWIKETPHDRGSINGQAAQVAHSIASLLAAHPAPAVEPQWQPIETAPKDGTSVLLCCARDADGERIDWNKDLHTAQVFVQVAAWWSGDGDWIVYCSQIAEPRLHFNPTHWKPLPDAPKEGGAA